MDGCPVGRAHRGYIFKQALRQLPVLRVLKFEVRTGVDAMLKVRDCFAVDVITALFPRTAGP